MAVVVVSALSGGCLTLDPSVSLAPGNATVFENASSSGTWASGRIVTPVELTTNATTDQGVTQLNVVASDGKTFYTTPVDSGQTNLSVIVPTGTRATLVAVNTVNGTTVETRNVTITGNTVV